MGKRWQSGDGARPAVSSKGGGGSVLVDEVIRMCRGEAKVWNGGGGWWREESGRDVKGNGDRWRWSLNPSVPRS
jgi:hypothetical protein